MHSKQLICMSPDILTFRRPSKYDGQTKNVIILEIWLFIAQNVFVWIAHSWRIAILLGFL